MARRVVSTEIEFYPEADCLEGYPHPRHAHSVYGHTVAKQLLSAAVKADKLHHAWIITGSEGIGKATLAYQFAKYVLAAPQDRIANDEILAVRSDSVAAHQVKSLSHPGLLVLRRNYDIKNKRFTTAITVDEVRRLRSFLNHSPGDRAWRVIIVDRADELNTNAANALLKSLEEPPARTVFLLIAVEPGRLLPTIRSRCRHLALQPLSAADATQATAQAAEAAGTPPDAQPNWNGLVDAAGGSVRRLLTFAADGGLDVAATVDELLSACAGASDWPKQHALAERLAPAQMQQTYQLFLDLFFERLAELIKSRATGAGSERRRQLAARLIRDGTLASWVELWETLQRERTAVQALNLDRTAFLLDAMARIQNLAGEPSNMRA
ncbi:MAG: DNA polymerase III subunit delta' [Hyphomicrobiaceae bacterium]